MLSIRFYFRNSLSFEICCLSSILSLRSNQLDIVICATCSSVCLHFRKMALKFMKFVVQNRMYSTQVLRTKIGLLGVPYNGGTSKKVGTELGPARIREQGLTKEIREFNENVDIKDFGDLDVNIKEELKLEPTNMLNYNGFMPLMKRISEKVEEIRAENRTCITLGGDHGIAVGKEMIFCFE